MISFPTIHLRSINTNDNIGMGIFVELRSISWSCETLLIAHYKDCLEINKFIYRIIFEIGFICSLKQSFVIFVFNVVELDIVETEFLF